MVLPELKADIPELEPPQVLLEQLAQLSRLSAASAPDAGRRPVKAFLATVTFTVLATVAWLTGTLPGVASPFTWEPNPRPAPQHAPADHAAQGVSGGEETALVVPPTVAPGHGQPHHGKGHHAGQTKPHTDNGNHTGQTKPHTDNGNHTGQTRPHPHGHGNGNQR